MNKVKFSQDSSCITWLNGKQTNVSRTETALKMLVYSPFNHRDRYNTIIVCL